MKRKRRIEPEEEFDSRPNGMVLFWLLFFGSVGGTVAIIILYIIYMVLAILEKLS